MKSKEKKVKELSSKSKKILKPSLKPVEKPPKKLKMNRLALDQKKKEAAGIVYVGHLPYGFDENGLREFFIQYGEVSNVRLARSKKTGRSKGHGWVEFPFKEVAEIAAQSMNNYVTNGRRLVCELVQDSKPVFTSKTEKKFKFINWQDKFRREKNQTKTPEQIKFHVQKLLDHEEAKRKKIEELGINYKFPGYADLIEKFKKTHQTEKA